MGSGRADLDRRLYEETRRPQASSSSRPAGADQEFPPVWIPTTRDAHRSGLASHASAARIRRGRRTLSRGRRAAAGSSAASHQGSHGQIWRASRQGNHARSQSTGVLSATRPECRHHTNPEARRESRGASPGDRRPRSIALRCGRSSEGPAAAVPSCATGLARRQPRAASRERKEGWELRRREGAPSRPRGAAIGNFLSRKRRKTAHIFTLTRDVLYM